MFIDFYAALIVLGVSFLFFAAQTGNPALIIFAIAFVLACIVLGLVQAALQGVYSAALYRYATGANVGAEFSVAMLQNAFRTKG